MSHEIFGERFIGRDVPAWHKLGEVFDVAEHVTVTDAVVRTKSDYRLAKVRVGSVEAFDELIPIPMYAVVREATDDDPQPRFINMVSEDFELMDNLTVAKIGDPLAEIWPLDALGSLREGRELFFTLKIGKTVLNGSDEVVRYFMVHAPHDGGAITTTVSAVRTVCANTVDLAIARASSRVSLPHLKGVDGELKAVMAVVAKMEQADAEAVKTLESLAASAVTKAQVERIIAAAYPEREETGRVRIAKQAEEVGLLTESMKKSVQRWELRREAVLRRKALAWGCYHKLCDEYPDIAGTAWAALNAVTEVENHRAGDDGAASILVGSRASTMERSLRLAVAIAREGGSARTVSLRRRDVAGA
jgi:hypothetical protein